MILRASLQDKPRGKDKKKIWLISKGRAILESQNNMFMFESYSYISVKRARSLFNKYLCKRGVLIGVVLVC
jgi:hypothetical protein